MGPVRLLLCRRPVDSGTFPFHANLAFSNGDEKIDWQHCSEYEREAKRDFEFSTVCVMRSSSNTIARTAKKEKDAGIKYRCVCACRWEKNGGKEKSKS